MRTHYLGKTLLPLVATAGLLAATAHPADAQSVPLSDQMIISRPSGIVYDATNSETGAEMPLVYGPLPNLFSATSLTSLINTSSVVGLLEPNGPASDADGGAIPLTGGRYLSDLVMSTTFPGQATPTVVLLSDNSTPFNDFRIQIAAAINTSTNPNLTFATETGTTQNLSAPLHVPGYTVNVMSDVEPVPLPSSLPLLLSGVGLFIVAMPRRTTGRKPGGI